MEAHMATFDNIASSFNGVQTTFALAVGGSPYAFPVQRTLDISVGGVLNYEGTDYTIAGSDIIFIAPPLSGNTFAGEISDLDVQYTSIINTPQIANGETVSTQGQTVFNLTGVSGTPFNIHVYLNGVKLAGADYSAQYLGNANTLKLTLTASATAGDVLSISTSHQGGSSAALSSGEIVDSSLVLYMTDGTNVTIDVSALI